MNSELPTFAAPDPTWKPADSNPPKSGTLVKYRTALYQMFGYLDAAGQWIATDGRQEALPVKTWREIIDPASAWPERSA